MERGGGEIAARPAASLSSTVLWRHGELFPHDL
jgi:hypothetical protein